MRLKLLSTFAFAAILFSCSTSEQIDEGASDVAEIHVINLPYVATSFFDDDIVTRGFVDVENSNKFYFTSKDSIGIFPRGGYQIPFEAPLAEGEKQEQVTIIANGWNTKAGVTYAAYYPFVYDYRDGSKIPFSYLGQKQASSQDVSNLAKYSFRISEEAAASGSSFSFHLNDIGSIMILRLNPPTGTTNNTWHKVILQSSSADVFNVTGTINLFSSVGNYGTITPTLQSSSISIDLNDFQKPTSSDYLYVYLKIPATTLPAGTVLTCWLYDTEGNAYSCSYPALTSDLTLDKSTYVRPKFESFTLQETGSNVAAANLDQALDNITTPSAEITVGDNNPQVDEITVPTSVTQSGSSEVTITFQNPVATTASNATNTIEVTDGSASDAAVQTESLSTINLVFAANENASDNPSLDINMPSSTVNLSPSSGVTHFNVVTTKTAKNTLIIESGMDIDKLYVLGGNVVIMAGAHVGEIINSAGASSSIINWNDGGTTGGTVTAEGSGYTSGN